MFTEDMDGRRYRLLSDGHLVSASGGHDPVINVTHAVFTVRPVKDAAPDWDDKVNAQRVTQLLTQLDAGNANADKASIAFVTDTLKAYSSFTALQRYQGLKQREEALSPDEAALMARLARQLGDDTGTRPFFNLIGPPTPGRE